MLSNMGFNADFFLKNYILELEGLKLEVILIAT